MPNYKAVSTPTLVFLLKEWEAENRRKPTRKTMKKIRAIKEALAERRQS